MEAGHNGEFFVAHDLLHYAVENTLGFSTAFWGMVAAGRDLDDFGTRGGAKDERPFTAEAMRAEEIVGQIQLLCPPGKPIEHEVEGISAEEVQAIHSRWSHLISQWHALPFGDHLLLAFPPPL
jgi:hypothetical protein